MHSEKVIRDRVSSGRSASTKRCAASLSWDSFSPATLELVSRARIAWIVASSCATSSTLWRMPSSSTSKSAAVRFLTGAPSRVTETSSRTTSIAAPNLGTCAGSPFVARRSSREGRVPFTSAPPCEASRSPGRHGGRGPGGRRASPAGPTEHPLRSAVPENLDRARAIATTPPGSPPPRGPPAGAWGPARGPCGTLEPPPPSRRAARGARQEEVRERLRGASTALVDDAPELLAGPVRLSRALEGATQAEPRLRQGGVDDEGLAVLPLRLLHQVARRAGDALPAQPLRGRRSTRRRCRPRARPRPRAEKRPRTRGRTGGPRSRDRSGPASGSPRPGASPVGSRSRVPFSSRTPRAISRCAGAKALSRLASRAQAASVWSMAAARARAPSDESIRLARPATASVWPGDEGRDSILPAPLDVVLQQVPVGGRRGRARDTSARTACATAWRTPTPSSSRKTRS